MTENKEQMSKTKAFLRLFRFSRTLMAAAITGSAAFTAGTGPVTALWLALAGWCLAVGGFSLSAYARQRSQEKKTEDLIAPALKIVFFLVFTAASFAVTFLTAPLTALIPWGLILIIVICLSFQLFKDAIVRTFLIGLLHALHMLMGFAAGTLNPKLALPAAMLFFAVFAARGVIDIRNFPEDLMTRKLTLPKRLGMTKTVILSIICLTLAYVSGIVFYFVAKPGFLYLIPIGILVLTGAVCVVRFVKKAGPPMARKLTPFFTTITVLLICLSLSLGKL